MRQAIIRVRPERDGSLPEFEDLFEHVRDAEVLDAEMLSCDLTSGVVRLTVAKELDETLLAESDAVTWWERIGDEGGPTYLLELGGAGGPDVIEERMDELVPGETIAVTEDGFVTDVSGTQAAIGEVIRAYERAGMSVSLERIRDYEAASGPIDALTDRQREVLETAFEMGYYDVPRGATTDALAAEIDLDPSTVSEHLRRAERNVVAAVLTP